MRRVPFLASLIIALMLMSGCGSSKRLLEPEPNWIFLAQGKANHLREKDVFTIRNREKFAALKIYAYHRAVTISRMEITLVNGDVLTPAIDPHIGAGDRSRTIELSADGRQVEKITLRYKSAGKLFTDKALIQIGGLRPNEDRR